MTQEWRTLSTGLEVFQAQAAGEEIEYISDAGNYKYEKFKPWDGRGWHTTYEFRSRPKKRTKTIVLREALMFNGRFYWTAWFSEDTSPSYFVRWLDTPPREVEVDCD